MNVRQILPSTASPPTARKRAGHLLSSPSPQSIVAVQSGQPVEAEPAQSSHTRAGSRPRIDYLATGGTIASVPSGMAQGATPTLTADEIAGSVPAIHNVADLRTSQFMQRASTTITFADLLRLSHEIGLRIAAGSSGVVVTQGTDTIEETAFLLDVLCAGDPPIVITGAMRGPSVPGADGPANLLAAVQVAASASARGLGALVVLNDQIHAARFVSKRHTSSPSTFQSPLTGPLGWVSEGRVVIATRPVGRVHVELSPDAVIPPVALVRLALGDDGRILPELARLGYRGVVIEGFGGGHVTPAMMPLLKRLVTQMPIVLTSRTGSGEVLSHTYRYPGSEIELLELGLISAAALDGLKGRLLLSVCLAANYSPQQVSDAFQTGGATSAPIPT